jgi:Icc-related predicted phosphoesterase
VDVFWRARSRKSRLRLFFATDVHGSTLAFRKFLAAPRFYAADAVVLGGDLTGKSIVPLADGRNSAPELEERLENEGAYLWRPRGGAAEGLPEEEATRQQIFTDLACERLRAWLKRAEEVLAESSTPCYVIAGNDDPPDIAEILAAHDGPWVRYCEERTLELGDGYTISGFGWSNPTPWRTPREIDETQLDLRLRQMIGDGFDAQRSIFDIHVPPHGVLDVCPLLDTSTDPPKPILKAGQVATGSVGSTAVRTFVTEHQPLLVLSGHVHEARGAARLGRTLIVNPGSEYREGVLRGALIHLEDGHVSNYQLTVG